jgi:hypothetical protein
MIRKHSDFFPVPFAKDSAIFSYPLLPGRAGMAAEVTGQCFLAGGRSSSSDELSIVKSITSTFFLFSDGFPSCTGLYWRPIGGKKTVSEKGPSMI